MNTIDECSSEKSPKIKNDSKRISDSLRRMSTLKKSNSNRLKDRQNSFGEDEGSNILEEDQESSKVSLFGRSISKRFSICDSGYDDEADGDIDIACPCIVNTYLSLLLNESNENHKVICESDCILLRMSHADFKKIFEYELEKIRNEKVADCMKIFVLAELPEHQLRDLVIYKLEEFTCIFRNYLFNFGDTVEYLYFIRSGEFEVELDLTTTDKDVMEKVAQRMKNPIKEFILNGRQVNNLVDKEEKIVAKYRLTKGEVLGDFEIAMDMRYRISRVVCISEKGQ